MCQYCGCQEVAAIAELTAEHDVVVTLIRNLGEQLAAGRLADVAATSRLISEVLRPHTIVEEEGLFPELSQEFPGQLEGLMAEHRTVERVLEEAVEGVPVDPTWPERLQTTLTMLRNHILKEQDGVFPAAVISLGAEQWERVERARVRAGSSSANLTATGGTHG